MSDGAEDSITGIAEARNDVGEFVESVVEGRGVHLDLRMVFGHPLNPLGRGHETKEPNRPASSLLQIVHRVGGAPSGGEHRIHHQDWPFGDVGRKFLVVLDGLMRCFVSLYADVADPSLWNETEHPVGHAKARTENRDDGDGGGELGGVAHVDRGLDSGSLRREIAKCLVGHQPGDFTKHSSEGGGRRLKVPENAQLVTDQGVIMGQQIGMFGRTSHVVSSLRCGAVRCGVLHFGRRRDPEGAEPVSEHVPRQSDQSNSGVTNTGVLRLEDGARGIEGTEFGGDAVEKPAKATCFE